MPPRAEEQTSPSRTLRHGVPRGTRRHRSPADDLPRPRERGARRARARPRLPGLARPHVDPHRDAARRSAQPRRRVVRAAWHEPPVGGEPRVLPRVARPHRDRVPRHPAARLAGDGLHQRRAGLHRRPHRGTWAAGLPPGRVPDRRPHSRGDREARARGRARSEPTGPRHRAQRRDGGRRDHHDHLPDLLHAARGATHARGVARPASRRSHGRATSASGATSTRRSPDMSPATCSSASSQGAGDDRALRRGQRVRDRARPARRHPRPRPARGGDARGDHRVDRRAHRDELGSLPRSSSLSSSPTSSSRIRFSSRSSTDGRCSCHHSRCSVPYSSALNSRAFSVRSSRSPSRARCSQSAASSSNTEKSSPPIRDASGYATVLCDDTADPVRTPFTQLSIRPAISSQPSPTIIRWGLPGNST